MAALGPDTTYLHKSPAWSSQSLNQAGACASACAFHFGEVCTYLLHGLFYT